MHQACCHESKGSSQKVFKLTSKEKDTMTFKKYINNFIYFIQDISDFIQPSSISKLHEIRIGLFELLEDKTEPIDWEIDIPRSEPLKFKEFMKKDSRLEVSLNCKIKGKVDSVDAEIITIDKYNIEIKIWSLDKDLSYRPDFDSRIMKKVLKKNEWKRVMLSFHMDLRDESTKTIYEPLYHLHVGGRLNESELSWIPDIIEEPRFYFYPLDLVLLCEFVLLNFLPEESEYLRKKPEWTKRVLHSQMLFLHPYVSDFNKYLYGREGTLLNCLSRCV